MENNFDALDIALAEQRSQVWFDIRLGRFTSSEIYKLMQNGRSKDQMFSQTGMTYIASKVGEVLTGIKVESPYANALVYGEEMEPQAREYFSKVKGFEIQLAEFVPFTDHAGSSPDGYILSDGKKIAGLEIKCPFVSSTQVDYLFLKDQQDLKKDFPEYYWQVMSAMMFTKIHKWYFATYDPRMKIDKHKLKVIEVLADYNDQKIIAERLEKAIEEKLRMISEL